MQKSKLKFLRYGTAVLCVFGLLCIRGFETSLFYDPLHDYFRNDYLTEELPAFDLLPLTLSLSLRFLINSALSLLIIRLLFPNQKITWLAILYAILFLILVPMFFSVLAFWPENRFALFYIRRFLIQPLFLLLFVPALYYQQTVGLKKS
ncbi:exosortase F system-associated membrane protein [Flavobacterium silvaticum]|uniref:Exosortase F system-associated protein n=1 Tax=Flavobacterium silvaticum TaxID=1852020 RepID=A0A972FU05_9FLAO|nr:exosortase F system-associated protein [Flavobacterium silvaticum]NMH27560.1 exosortase F system-associated protein [Flavobacterium silvaticum]